MRRGKQLKSKYLSRKADRSSVYGFGGIRKGGANIVSRRRPRSAFVGGKVTPGPGAYNTTRSNFPTQEEIEMFKHTKHQIGMGTSKRPPLQYVDKDCR